jgi:hypothetical protein
MKLGLPILTTPRTRVLLSAGTVMLAACGFSLATASPAAAGGCDYIAGQELCGRVINHSLSDSWLKVANKWNCNGSGTACGSVAVIDPGEASVDKPQMTDADGVYIPSGCTGTMSGDTLKSGWHKISNMIGYYRVRVNC